MAKTYRVDTIKEKVNRMIDVSAQKAPENREARKALAILLTTVLHDTGNYNGFEYLDGDHGKQDDTHRRYN